MDPRPIKDRPPVDLADFLAQELYGRNAMARDLLGGSNANIFKHATEKIRELRREISLLLKNES